jgi:hypothetical protein
MILNIHERIRDKCKTVVLPYLSAAFPHIKLVTARPTMKDDAMKPAYFPAVSSVTPSRR